jgi:glutamyl-tRNA synthetase
MAAGFISETSEHTTFAAIVDGAGDRMKMAGDILDFEYFFTDDITYDEKAFQKRIAKPENARGLLVKLADFLESDSSGFDVDQSKQLVEAFCAAESIELKDIIHALRVATTGTAAGFGMFETLAILGKDKVVARVRDAAKAS